ncbi:helix-turn-helix domain-containing protein [Amycolatopsis sp. NPDC051061]|uniref:winged helix-turn-helix transcriptional regulator n=1 Tax=Amycolatopsis sp. NPDC051061 TaxID=3155042 RepID=UPI0034468387
MASVSDTRRPSAHGACAPGRPCRALSDLFGTKWTVLVIGVLEDEPLRFGELRRRLAHVSPKVLAQTLRRLERYGLVDRTIYPVVPMRVEYALTRLGRSAAEPLDALWTWVGSHAGRQPEPVTPPRARPDRIRTPPPRPAPGCSAPACP